MEKHTNNTELYTQKGWILRQYRNFEKKIQMRHILQNIRPRLLKTGKVIKTKGRLQNCPSQDVPETWLHNVLWCPGQDPEQKKDKEGKTEEMWIKYETSVNNRSIVAN